MQTLIFINGNNEEINLTSGNYGITNWEGFSNAELNIQSQQVPYNDGSVFLDALLEQRELTVTVAINDNNNLATRYEKKRELISILNAKEGEGYLYYTNDYLSRRIKVIPHLPIFENKNSNDAGTLKASVTFTACSPYWEDVEETTVTINSYEQKTITNDGDVPCSVQLEGVNTNSPFRLFNNTSGKKIATKDNISLAIELNTGLGEKTFKKGRIGKVFENGVMNEPNSITFNPITNQYVILSWNGIWVCDDEENWYLKNENYSGSGFIFYDEDYNYYIVAVGTAIYTTEDLETLTRVATITGASNKIWKIGGMYIISTGNRTYYGTDLTSLTLLYVETSLTVFKKNSSIYVIGKNYTHIYSSSSWTSTSHGMTVTDACNNGDYVIILADNRLYYSNDYSTWTQITSGASAKNPIYSSILEKWIYTNSSTMYTSRDLSTWENQSIDWGGADLLFIETRENKDLIFIQSFSNVGQELKRIKTTDLTNFTISDIGYHFSGSTKSYLTKDENSLYFVMGGEAGGKCLIFKKSTSWELVTTLENIFLQGFKYIAETNKFLILSGNTKVYESEDLEIWNSYSISANNVIYVNGQYVFVGSSGTITITTDFIDIQTYNFLTTDSLLSIDYCNEYYYITCASGIACSTDAINWSWVYQTNLTVSQNKTCLHNNELYIAGGSKVIIVSGHNSYRVISFSLPSSYQNIFYSEKYNCFILSGGGLSFATTDFESYAWIYYNINFLEEFENEIYIVNVHCYKLSLATENAISDLTTDSDMTLGLEVGENKLTITGQIDGVYYLTYRQKYLGV